MNRTRFLLADLLVCLPLIVIVVAGIWVYFRVLPLFETEEAETLTARYKAIAVQIKDGEAEGVGEFPAEGLKFSNRLAKGAWGVESTVAGKRVWYHEPKAPTVRGSRRTARTRRSFTT